MTLAWRSFGPRKGARLPRRDPVHVGFLRDRQEPVLGPPAGLQKRRKRGAGSHLRDQRAQPCRHACPRSASDSRFGGLSGRVRSCRRMTISAFDTTCRWPAPSARSRTGYCRATRPSFRAWRQRLALAAIGGVRNDQRRSVDDSHSRAVARRERPTSVGRIRIAADQRCDLLCFSRTPGASHIATASADNRLTIGGGGWRSPVGPSCQVPQ